MAVRGTLRIPIWVRVFGIVVLVLVGVIVGATLLGTAGVGGGHAPAGDEAELDGNRHGPEGRMDREGHHE